MPISQMGNERLERSCGGGGGGPGLPWQIQALNSNTCLVAGCVCSETQNMMESRKHREGTKTENCY